MKKTPLRTIFLSLLLTGSTVTTQASLGFLAKVFTLSAIYVDSINNTSSYNLIEINSGEPAVVGMQSEIHNHTDIFVKKFNRQEDVQWTKLLNEPDIENNDSGSIPEHDLEELTDEESKRISIYISILSLGLCLFLCFPFKSCIFSPMKKSDSYFYTKKIDFYGDVQSKKFVYYVKILNEPTWRSIDDTLSGYGFSKDLTCIVFDFCGKNIGSPCDFVEFTTPKVCRWLRHLNPCSRKRYCCSTKRGLFVG